MGDKVKVLATSVLGNLELMISQPWHHGHFGLDNSFLLGVLSWALWKVNSGPGSYSLEASGIASPLSQWWKPSNHLVYCHMSGWRGAKLPPVKNHLVNGKNLHGCQKGKKVAVFLGEDQYNLFILMGWKFEGRGRMLVQFCNDLVNNSFLFHYCSSCWCKFGGVLCPGKWKNIETCSYFFSKDYFFSPLRLFMNWWE